MKIKTFIMLQKISISEKCCSSECTIHQRNMKKFYTAVFNNNNNNNNSNNNNSSRINNNNNNNNCF